VVNATPQQITCFGANNGSITPIVTGGTPSYIYAWTASGGGIISTSPTASNISGLVAGTYTLTVIDANSCTATGTWQIDPAPPLLVITETHTDPLCHDDANGTITVTVNGGTPGYTITGIGAAVIITTGPNSHTFSNLAAGSYTITVIDSNGCDSSITILLVNPLNITLSASTTPVSCNDGVPLGNNGTIIFSASGGTGTLSYSTVPATTSGPVLPGNNVISNLSAGSYILTITDQNGCDSIITVTITEPEPISFDSISSNINCYGENNGEIIISNIIGGTPAYSYLWTGPSITVSTSTITSQSNLAPGLYTFKVTDANGCFKQLSWNITQPFLPITITPSNTINTTCYDSLNGSISIAATGGIPGYQIEYQRITPSGTLISPVGIEIQLSGGSYIINDLSAGDYEFTVTDANGCSVDSTFSISSPPEFVATVSSDSILCNPPNNTGEIIITTPPGSYPVTYYITSPSSSAPIIGAIINSPHTIPNLPGGTYDIVLTYNSGLCSQNLSTTIEPASPLFFDSSIVNNISCYGENDGEICVYVTGGAAPYTYSWSIPGTSSCQNNLAPGQYTFTVTDANGCSIGNTYTINAPATPLIASVNSTAVLCFGEDDGTITVTVSGGSPNYTLTSPTLNPPNAIIALSGGSYIYPNVSSGTHNITVTDANGCDTTFSVSIESPTSLPSITGLTVQNILCFEDLNTGEIDFNIIGGTAPYTLTWLNSPTSCPAPATIITSSVVSVTALCKGSYTLLITDANGCSINNFIINITAPTAPLSVVTSQTNNLCFGDCNGIATSAPSGGTAPYQHSWSNGQTTPTITGLCLGDYYDTITDANGCFIIAQFSITAPAQPITVSETHINVDCFDNATGSILVSAYGGTPGYNVSWLPIPPIPPAIIEMPASGDTYNITGLLAGLYDITITDLNNCVVVIDNIPITQPAEMTYAIAHSNITCFGANDGSITLDVNGGVVDGSGEYASYIWSSTDVVAPCIIPINEISPSGLCPGEYTVVVTDWNGCTITTSATIIEPDLLTNTVQQTDVLCFGDNTGSASVFVLGGTPFATGNQYLYSWTGPASFVSGNQTINGLGVGQYNVLVTDDNGCTSNNVVNIIMSTSALTAAGNSTPVSCFNGTNGTAIITASNGTAPYVVTGITVPFLGNIPISGGAIIKPNLSAGTYDFSITDANDCETILTIVVTTPPLLTATGIVSNQLCFVPLCTGSITTNVIGGTPAVSGNDYIYVWTSTSTSIPVGANPAGLCVGTYTLVVSDMNGCSTAPQLFTITSPTILQSNISAVNVTTFGAATGAIDLSVSGGVSPYDYNWEVSFDGGTTWVPTTLPGVQDQNNLPAGLYQVTITDANGCTTSNAVTITQPSSGITATPIIMPVGCFGDLTGGINLGVSGGSGSYSYQWSGPGVTMMTNTNQNQSNLGAGSYTVIITDNVTNAFATYTYIITQPATALVLGTPVFVLIPNPGNPPCSNQYTITAPAAGGTAPYDYYWYDTSNDLLFNGPSYTGSAGDVFILNVYDANDCLASIPISLPNPFRIEVDFEITGICNDLLSGVSIGTIVSGGLPGYNYSWSPGIVPSGVIPPGQSNLPSLSNIGSGWYNLTITDQCGSTLDTFVFVPPIQPALILNAVASVNAGCTNTTGLITVTATNGYVPYDVEWQGIGGTIGSGNPVGTEISSSGGSYSINNLSSGNYAITLTDSYGCSADTTVFIDNIDPVVPNFSISNILCNTTNVTFTNTTAPNTPGLIWDWQFSDGQSSNEENPTLIFSTPGLITVILTATDTTGFASGSNNNGCVFVGLSQTITILEVPNASFIASPQEISGFSGEVTFVNTSINADSYIWNFGDGNGSNQESPVHQFVAGDTEYTVTLTAISINGCTDDTSIIIRLTNPLVLWVPNTFTPNYNDNNEVFLPIFSDPSLVREYKLLIFNRWGEIVFESNDIEVGWDGYYKQMDQYGVQKVQDGTYIWQIRYIDAYSVTHNEKGHINVLK
jgi:gliding motility-associated-like protein